MGDEGVVVVAVLCERGRVGENEWLGVVLRKAVYHRSCSFLSRALSLFFVLSLTFEIVSFVE